VFVVYAIVAYRGSAEGVAKHTRWVIAHDAAERELPEAFEATMIPGGAPNFLTPARTDARAGTLVRDLRPHVKL
jgi:hypothetical protein